MSKALRIPSAPRPQPRRVIVFSGHMIDAPGRKEPRFPPDKERTVGEKVAARFDDWKVGPGDLTISGAARGGDLLFAELGVERGAVVWIFLPRPENEFIEESVHLPGSNWEQRFKALLAHPRVSCFYQKDYLGDPSDGLGVHARNNLWMVQAAKAIAPSPQQIFAVMVWDEKPTGDGPGGTSDFVKRIAEAGGNIAPVINPSKL